MSYNKIGIIIINFLRPDSTIKCVDSLLKQCPDINVYLGDQDDNSVLKGHYKQENIKYCPLPYDCGISYARNTLVTQAISDGCDYFMWADNDFIFDNQLNLDHTINILKNDPKIGVVGGSLRVRGSMGHYERFMYYDEERGVLLFIPIEYTHPVPKQIGKVKYFDCDITFNFCVARKEVWQNPRVRWNENIKVKYEHSTWFILLKKHSYWRVAYCPSFNAMHVHTGTNQYKNFRFRTTDEDEFARFFKLKGMFAIGESGRDFTTKRSTVATPKTMVKAEEQSEKVVVQPAPVRSLVHEIYEAGITPILLEQTCKEFIAKVPFSNYKQHFAVKNEKDLEKLKEVVAGRAQCSIWEKDTKQASYGGCDLLVPFPVVSYLQRIYGRRWNK